MVRGANPGVFAFGNGVCVCVDGTGIAIFAGCGESDFGIVAELADDG